MSTDAVAFECYARDLHMMITCTMQDVVNFKGKHTKTFSDNYASSLGRWQKVPGQLIPYPFACATFFTTWLLGAF